MPVSEHSVWCVSENASSTNIIHRLIRMRSGRLTLVWRVLPEGPLQIRRCFVTTGSTDASQASSDAPNNPNPDTPSVMEFSATVVPSPRQVVSRLLCAAVLLCAGAFCFSVRAADDLNLSAYPDRSSYAPGDTVTLIIEVEIPRGYRLYGNPLGPGIGKPLRMWVESGDDITWFQLLKTPAQRHFPDVGEWVWAYENKAHFFFRGVATSRGRKEVQGKAVLDGLICRIGCIATVKRVPFEIKIDRRSVVRNFRAAVLARNLMENADTMAFVRKAAEQPQPSLASTIIRTFTGPSKPARRDLSGQPAAPVEQLPQWEYEAAETTVEFDFWLAVFFAFVAGILLNFMPCVLPVLGIKILSFSHHAPSRRAALVRSLIFSAGMMSVFMILATFAAFAGFSWGQQFREPRILVAIISLVVLFGLGMFDLFVIAVPSEMGRLERHAGEGPVGNFLKGMLAAILATPCSGPFLGATLAWTLTQSPLAVYLVFAAIGAGMALPYVLLSSSRRLTRLIPKPGRWMVDFKYFIGFMLLGFAVYLMAGLPDDLILTTVGFCVALALATGLYGRISGVGASICRRAIALVVALAVALGGVFAAYGIPAMRAAQRRGYEAGVEESTWAAFTPQSLFDAHARGQHVVLNFTASWCMNCQYNRITVLEDRKVVDLLRKKGVLTMKADLTTENPAAESLLQHLGSRSIPFLAIFKGDDPYNPIIMRDIIDKRAFIKVLRDLNDKQE